jgi:rhomboid protease GluP
MSSTNPTALDAVRPEIPSQTFCTYLAKQFIAKKGFGIAQIPELQKLVDSSDIVLAHSDGGSLAILCMIDREKTPNRIFTPGIDDVEAIGQACLKYAGQVESAKVPVKIMIMEIGPGAADQEERLSRFKPSSPFSKVVLSALIVDTASSAVWASDKTWFSGKDYQDFIATLLGSPRESDADLTPPPAVVIAPLSFPIVTAAILAVLVAIFAAEIVFGIGPSKALQPTIATLLAFGGLSRDLVLQSGEWYRLLSAPFLHLDPGHLAMNSIGLLLAGSRLESLIGRAWFAAIYVVGGLGGSLLSLAFNPASIVSVGASGAIMGLFAAMLVTSRHFPPGAVRSRLQANAFYVLIPSLLPLANMLQGHRIDLAAHLGGAMSGAIVGVVMTGVWSTTEPWPRYRNIATAIAVTGVVALAYPIASVARQYDTAAFAEYLMPRESYPSEAVGISQSYYYVKRYPRDPRSHLFRALALFTEHDFAGAESEKPVRACRTRSAGARCCRARCLWACGRCWRSSSPAIAWKRQRRSYAPYAIPPQAGECAKFWTTQNYVARERRPRLGSAAKALAKEPVHSGIQD